MVSSSAARPTSAAIMIRRRCPVRSTQAPACRANSRLGSHAAATRPPISAGPAWRISTAVSGTASRDTWSPKIETVWPAQRTRNGPRCRSRAGTRRRIRRLVSSSVSAPPKVKTDETAEVLGPGPARSSGPDLGSEESVRRSGDGAGGQRRRRGVGAAVRGGPGHLDLLAGLVALDGGREVAGGADRGPVDLRDHGVGGDPDLRGGRAGLDA